MKKIKKYCVKYVSLLEKKFNSVISISKNLDDFTWSRLEYQALNFEAFLRLKSCGC